MRNPPDGGKGQGSPPSAPPSTSPAASSPVRLRDAHGREVEGWAVRRDLVVARCAGLRPPLTITLGTREMVSIAVYERTVEADDGTVWTAAVLPEGTLPLDGELLPPGFDRLALSALPLTKDLTAHRSEAPAQVTRSLWCFLFPRVKGC